MIYYVNSLNEFNNYEYIAGDTVLFLRGSIYRGRLECCNDVTYSAYGEGDNPIFTGSVDIGDSKKWIEEFSSIWRYTEEFSSEPCNLIFNDGESCGNLRWSLEELKNQGEWFYSSIGETADISNFNIHNEYENRTLYIYSSANPGEYYSSIECPLFEYDYLVNGKKNIVIENFTFKNGGIHGYHEVQPENVTIRNCEFRNIGGAVWIKDEKIRLGNGVQFWNGANDMCVEGCIFDNIFDSGVTHQGYDNSETPENIYFRNNLFIDCGMAAYELRGPAGKEIYFENNTCINAGGGFSMQGNNPPRNSEIYPQPMGHHVFIWRVDKDKQKDNIYIRNNIFCEAQYGTAIYSIIDEEAEKKVIIDNNCYYQSSGDLLFRMRGMLYTWYQFEKYKEETRIDKNSIFHKPVFLQNSKYEYMLDKDDMCGILKIGKLEKEN